MNSHATTTQATVDPAAGDFSDVSCLIPCFEPLETLVRSIERNGLINVPVVKTLHDGKTIPVLGRRRLMAALRLGLTGVTVRMLTPELSEAECFSLAFWDNVVHRRLDTALTAFLVARLEELFPRERAAAEFLPVLGLSGRGPRPERLRAIGRLDLHILEALSQGRILEKTAYLTAGLDASDRVLVMGLAGKLGLNSNKAAELIENLVDLSVFHGRSLEALVADKEARNILDDADLTAQERGSRFRELIRSWKYPELTAKEQEFRAWLRTLPASGKIAVKPTQAFEDGRCTVEIKADSWDDAAAIVKKTAS